MPSWLVVTVPRLPLVVLRLPLTAPWLPLAGLRLLLAMLRLPVATLRLSAAVPQLRLVALRFPSLVFLPTLCLDTLSPGLRTIFLPHTHTSRHFDKHRTYDIL